MQTRNKFLDDMSQLMTNAMGVAQGAREEAETAMKSLMDRWLADRDFVTREEFDAVRAMAQKAREENAALSARIVALEEAAAKGVFGAPFYITDDGARFWGQDRIEDLDAHLATRS